MSAWPNDRGIYAQLRKLADFIAKTRAEIGQLHPEDVKVEFITKATDELDAIVEATASATHRIMDAADLIMDAASKLPNGQSDQIMASVTSIYEACTFQDITGQRVTKIVGMLKTIEERLDRMVAALAESDVMGVPTAPTKLDGPSSDNAFIESREESDARLLNGPALPGRAHSQADIDAIFADGGKRR